LYKIYLLATKK